MTPATKILFCLTGPSTEWGRRPRLRGTSTSRQLCLLLLLTLPLLAADSLTERGVAAFQHGHYIEAGRLLQDALKADPTDDHARTFLALSRAATGHCAQAIPDLADRFENSANPDLSRLAGLALQRREFGAHLAESVRVDRRNLGVIHRPFRHLPPRH